MSEKLTWRNETRKLSELIPLDKNARQIREDTDLSLRALKDGWCTILFYVFVGDKVATMTMKGGNTEQLYQGDGRWEMAWSLKKQHPQLVKIKKRWGRWQHVVDYSPFKSNKPILKEGVEIPKGTNNYGMKLTYRGEG